MSCISVELSFTFPLAWTTDFLSRVSGVTGTGGINIGVGKEDLFCGSITTSSLDGGSPEISVGGFAPSSSSIGICTGGSTSVAGFDVHVNIGCGRYF